MANSRTRSQLETELARRVGDASSAGVPAFARWGIDEYRDSINASIEVLRKKHMERTAVLVTITSGTYDYDITDSDLAYLSEAKAEANGNLYAHGPSVGSGLYEFIVPLDIVTFTRDPSTPTNVLLHFDKNSMSRHNLNQTGLKMRLIGYRHPPLLTASADTCVIPYPVLLNVAKAYLHTSATGRDNNDLMKHMRQWQAMQQEIARYDDQEIIESPGGLWVE